MRIKHSLSMQLDRKIGLVNDTDGLESLIVLYRNEVAR